MNHKQKCIRDYFLASLPGVGVTLFEDEHKYIYKVLVSGSHLSHLVIFDQEEFDNSSVRDLFNWLYHVRLIQTIKDASAPLEMTIRAGHLVETDGKTSGLAA